MSSSFLALIWCVSLKGLITRYNKLAFKIKSACTATLNIPCTEPSPRHGALKTFSEQFYTWGIHYLILFEQDGLKGFLPKRKKIVLCGREDCHHVVSPRASTFLEFELIF